MADLADDQTGEMEAAGYPKPDDVHIPPKYISFSTPGGPNTWVRDRFISGSDMRLPNVIRGSYSADPEAGDDATQHARERAERNPFGRLAWAMQDADDAKAPRSLSEHFLGRRLTDAEQPCMAISPQEQDFGERLMVQRAWGIAFTVHGGQFDKAGESYMFHVARVAMQMDTKSEQVAAILHDVLEDTNHRTHYEGIIREMFGRTIFECCQDLCRRPGEPYQAYIRIVGDNPLARKVKLADLTDNMSEPRLRKLPMHEADRLRKKYREAWDYLMGIVR